MHTPTKYLVLTNNTSNSKTCRFLTILQKQEIKYIAKMEDNTENLLHKCIFINAFYELYKLQLLYTDFTMIFTSRVAVAQFSYRILKS